MMKKSTIEAVSPAVEMTKREAIAMHILAGICADGGEGAEYSALARCAVRQTDALLVALHDDPEEEGDASPEAA